MNLTEADAAEILRLLEAGEAARSQVDRLSQGATADASRAQAVIEAVHDGARMLGHRSREMRQSASAVRDSLERARIAALNAGLEGARLGEPVGKAVLVMADDVRVLLARATEALEEHVALFGELERERERWLDELSQTRELVAAAAQRLRELGGLESASSQGLSRLHSQLRQHLGSAPERARLLADAGAQLRALSESLGKLKALGPEGESSASKLIAPLSTLLSRNDEQP
ncbi:MAG: methyl-accepting chemotaxis protein [Myxococcota bacterium]